MPTATQAVCGPRPCTPDVASAGPLSSCGPSTCAGGPSPDGRPRGMHRCNTRPSFGASPAEARNNPAGRTTRVEEGVRCVTTHPAANPFGPTRNRRQEPARSGRHFAAVGHAPPPRASDALQVPPDAAVAASSRASDAPIAGIRDLGSTAGSTAVPDTSAHTPCAGKSAIPAACPGQGTRLRVRPFRRYAARVPWEVTAPWGRPGRTGYILLGHFTP
jgi:hypothetical protein